ncbi:hypothetical protein [Mucisphaera sp.]|uniref:hypothetical protein n=1 Tax=Mucisphaera sp. TaxID=2913024 RepID=UPI003D116F7D
MKRSLLPVPSYVALLAPGLFLLSLAILWRAEGFGSAVDVSLSLVSAGLGALLIWAIAEPHLSFVTAKPAANPTKSGTCGMSAGR